MIGQYQTQVPVVTKKATPETIINDPGATLARIRPEVALPGYWENLLENCKVWAGLVESAAFWREVKSNKEAWRNEYFQSTGSSLLCNPVLPPFEAKGIRRIQEKLLESHEAKKLVFPVEGPPVPILNDLVRTRISCLYIDGVEFLGSKLLETGKAFGANPVRTREGTIDGYFAQHLTFQEDVFFGLGGGKQPVRITCEVQIASLLATRMWEASHPHYEIARKGEGAPEEWQWNPKDPRFLARQLGHMIHLADGLLMQLREASGTQGLKKD